MSDNEADKRLQRLKKLAGEVKTAPQDRKIVWEKKE